jgi:hypothetical protein
MHEGTPYGHLAINGKSIPDYILAKRCGYTLKEFRKAFKELEIFGIPRKNDKGLWYSKRMVTDDLNRIVWAKQKQRQRA